MFFNEVLPRVVGEHFDRDGEIFEPFCCKFIYFIRTFSQYNPWPSGICVLAIKITSFMYKMAKKTNDMGGCLKLQFSNLHIRLLTKYYLKIL